MDTEDREVIANFFDAGEAEVAQEALKIIGIESTVECHTSETADEYCVYVPAKNAERGTQVMEQVVEALTKKGTAPTECGKCRSQNLLHHGKTGAFGAYTVYLCKDCGHAMVR
jgi:hypothetical protein